MTKALMLLVGGDILITLMAHAFGVLAQFRGKMQWSSGLLPLGLRWLVFAVVLILATYLVELYSMEKRFTRKAIFQRILVALSLSLASLLALYHFYPQVGLDRWLVTLMNCWYRH